MFEPHPDFGPTSLPLGDLPLCHVRLQADARFPWLILIPRVAGAREIEDLAPDQRHTLLDEALRAGEAARAIAAALGHPAQKLNIAQLGNVTPQLHLHVIARRADDPAWPRPVWGVGEPVAYDPRPLEAAIATAKASLGL